MQFKHAMTTPLDISMFLKYDFKINLDFFGCIKCKCDDI